jgi:hypothetical protein
VIHDGKLLNGSEREPVQEPAPPPSTAARYFDNPDFDFDGEHDLAVAQAGAVAALAGGGAHRIALHDTNTTSGRMNGFVCNPTLQARLEHERIGTLAPLCLRGADQPQKRPSTTPPLHLD